MITKDNIKQILECNDIYAQKMVDWSNGDEEALIFLMNCKLKNVELEAVVEYGLRENQPDAYDLFESDGWKMLRVLPRDDGTY